MKKKLITAILAVALMMNVFVVPASAETISGSGSSFTSAWERYTSTTDGLANLTYGYNTWLIHEDYAWASHSTKSHYASLNNGNGNFVGPNKSATNVSKIEVTHSGTSVSYYCNY